MTNHEWDDNERPLAYLITIRTYGTWLHGDDRYSMDRHGKNIYGAPKIAANKNLAAMMRDNRPQESFLLDGQQRGIVEMAVKGVCKHRGYGLYAINVRTNHAHAVVSSSHKPEPIIIAFKSNSTRELRTAGLVSAQQSVWSRGGSRRYLWKPTHLEGAIDYVLYGQGDDLPNF
jgi:REP element-mobilizing transposase RayT